MANHLGEFVRSVRMPAPVDGALFDCATFMVRCALRGALLNPIYQHQRPFDGDGHKVTTITVDGDAIVYTVKVPGLLFDEETLRAMHVEADLHENCLGVNDVARSRAIREESERQVEAMWDGPDAGYSRYEKRARDWQWLGGEGDDSDDSDDEEDTMQTDRPA